ncbi:hypothetical protein PC110_g20519 [Phytophthora cactorum]|uniref:PiggyBac transposable element-derived protein domain-containing protein n=1 Tax=Phytophthora cactorum TaxID=29920 RepID=A0A329RED3_9STRA|nr:hypothetical protein PC119_g25056 [Phytophthora cactorum]RAW23045.1 hypothetical protein PC110_g20519 [Phytophthora cactorum]
MDRAWKIRKVVEVLQRTFREGYVVPAELSFDEVILPSRRSFNKCACTEGEAPQVGLESLHVVQFEVYCGKKQHQSDKHKPDKKEGPAAAARNLRAVLGDSPGGTGKRLVVIDCFYTSVDLAIELLLMGFYCVGTTMTNPVGFYKEVVSKSKSRPKNVDRGPCKIVESIKVPGLTAICWMDSNPVPFLASSRSVGLDRVVRRDQTGEQNEYSK